MNDNSNRVLVVVLVAWLLAGTAGPQAKAHPIFDATQPVAGFAENRWAFMTAWNLAPGALDVSPAWYYDQPFAQ